LPVEDKAYQRAALCVTAKLACRCLLWVRHDLDDQGRTFVHSRNTPEPDINVQICKKVLFVMAVTAAEALAWHVHSVDSRPLNKSPAMERFIRRENIKRYRKLLLEAKDESERRRIQKLLTKEEQKELAAEASSPSTARSRRSWHAAAGKNK
jgi:hypothetical protein